MQNNYFSSCYPYRATVTLGNMTTLPSSLDNMTILYFYTMELSLHATNVLVAGMRDALVHIDKVTGAIEILAGEPAEWGYVEGVGREARFALITGIAQLEHEYILSDSNNHCLRSVNYLSKETQAFAGLCEAEGTADGSLVSARFMSPHGLMRDPSNHNAIYLVDDKVLRKIDLSAETVITLPGSHLSVFSDGITMNPAGGILVTSEHGVMQYTLNETVQWLTGKTTQGTACDECDIALAKFFRPVGLRFITPEVLLVADRYNHKLRLVNLTSRRVTAIGAGEGRQDGPYQDSKLHIPQSIAVDNSFIYIGEDAAQGGGVRKLAYTGMSDSSLTQVCLTSYNNTR